MILRFLLISSLLSLAAEHTVEKGDVLKTAELDAKILPETCLPIKISPKQWSDFTVLEAAPHGKKVEQGEVLIQLKTDGITDEISDLKEEITLKTLELELQKKELADEEILTPLALKALEREVTREKADHTYYVEKQYEQTKETYDQFLQSIEWDYKNAQEEYKQLKAMYEEDDLTEETEEIILKRSQYMAEVSAWRLKTAQEEFGRMKEVRLPRTLEDRNHQQETDAYDAEEKRRTLALDLEKLKLEVKQQEVALGRAQEKLKKLEHDLTLMEITAPVTGTFFYGVIMDGSWIDATTTEKFMRKGGKLSTFKEIACVIPEGTGLLAYAQVESKSLGSLTPEKEGIFSLEGDPGNVYPVSCKEVGNMPLANGKFLVTLTLDADLPYTLAGKTKLLLAEKKEVVRIPHKALKTLPTGVHQVEIYPPKEKDEADKKAPEEKPEESVEPSEEKPEEEVPESATPDDPEQEKKDAPVKKEEKKEKRKAAKAVVKIGLYGDEFVEILEGLKEGDVIKTP